MTVKHSLLRSANGKELFYEPKSVKEDFLPLFVNLYKKEDDEIPCGNVVVERIKNTLPKRGVIFHMWYIVYDNERYYDVEIVSLLVDSWKQILESKAE